MDSKEKKNYKQIMISIVIPVKDEEGNIPGLAEEITAVFETHNWPWHCIWVDDGSTDKSLSKLESLSKKDPRHNFISFEKNQGQSAALWAGFRECKGSIIATIDGDAQSNPADLPQFVEFVHSGKADMVTGRRTFRKDSIVRKLCSRGGNWFIGFLTGQNIKDIAWPTRTFRRECLEYLPVFKGMHRFLSAVVAIQGYKVIEKPIIHRPRLQGKSKYTVRNRLWGFLADSFGLLWLKKRVCQYTIRNKSHKSKTK